MFFVCCEVGDFVCWFCFFLGIDYCDFLMCIGRLDWWYVRLCYFELFFVYYCNEKVFKNN